MPKTEKIIIEKFIEHLKGEWPKDATEAYKRLELMMPDKKRGRKAAKENIAELTDTSIFDYEGIEDYGLMSELLKILGDDNDSIVRCIICLKEMGLLKGSSKESIRLLMEQFMDVPPESTFRHCMAQYEGELPEKVYDEKQKEKDKKTILEAMEEMRYQMREYVNNYYADAMADYYTALNGD